MLDISKYIIIYFPQSVPDFRNLGAFQIFIDCIIILNGPKMSFLNIRF